MYHLENTGGDSVVVQVNQVSALCALVKARGEARALLCRLVNQWARSAVREMHSNALMVGVGYRYVSI